MSSSDVCYMDLETASTEDVKKCGASRLSRSPHTVVPVIAWAFGDGPVRSVQMPGRALPKEIADHIRKGGVISGWNAGNFELNFLRNYFNVEIADEQVSDTMQRSLYAGLPKALGDCGPALGLQIVKDKKAHGLMLRMARPRSRDPLSWWHETDQEKLDALTRYCEQDVEAERAISGAIPNIPPAENEICMLDRKANMKGVMLDVPAVHALARVASQALQALDAECAHITGGRVTSPGTQTAKLNAWLGENAPASLSKDHVDEALSRKDLPPDARRVLEIRQLAARASAKKLTAMLNCIDEDNVVRGVLEYYGASRTGRFSGKLIQPQNMPRPSIKKPGEAISMMLQGMDAQGVDSFFGPPLETIASCIRGLIIPRPGHRFIVFDLAQIEARVVAFMAKQEDVLDVFRSGEDVYVHTARSVGSEDRQLGKVLRLACAYGMGPAKFKDTASKPPYFVDLSLRQAEDAVRTWREASPKIVQFWWDCDRTIKDLLRAFRVRGERVSKSINPFVEAAVQRAGNGSPLLTITLPSGRVLFYRDVALEDYEDATTERTRQSVVYSGIDQKTKKWTRLRTYGGRTVENIIQAVSRDVIAYQMREIDAAGLSVLLSVHDELIIECPAEDAHRAYEIVERIMCTAPPWARACPIGAEGKILDRYGK